MEIEKLLIEAKTFLIKYKNDVFSNHLYILRSLVSALEKHINDRWINQHLEHCSLMKLFENYPSAAINICICPIILNNALILARFLQEYN